MSQASEDELSPSTGPSGGALKSLLIGSQPMRTVIRLVVLVVSSVVIFKFVLIPARIVDISMMPNYQPGQIKFINKLAFVSREPMRGEVVAIRYAGKSVLLLKRVIGLPGEMVEIRSGQVFIDGQRLEEPYLVEERARWNYSHRLGGDDYLVIGDNRSMGQDQHEWGYVSSKRIVGRIIR